MRRGPNSDAMTPAQAVRGFLLAHTGGCQYVSRQWRAVLEETANTLEKQEREDESGRIFTVMLDYLQLLVEKNVRLQGEKEDLDNENWRLKHPTSTYVPHPERAGGGT